jgi:multiple sugar transport system ATP-binding protein
MTLGVGLDRLTLTAPEIAHLSGEAKLIERLGDETILHLRLADSEVLTIKVPSDVALTIGGRVHARIEMIGSGLFGEDGRAMRLEGVRDTKA